ncbi:hypothetical protein PInf_021590 [Phytophthora infestans]|nr:hypothetical protein PInf_021590 [Phytophthora infestans]
MSLALADLRDFQDLLMIKKRDLDEWARQEKAAQAAFLTLAPSPTQQNSTLPAQAAGCLVFTTERIESLQAENKKLRQQFRDLHKQQNVLAKEKRQQQEAIARDQDRSEQLMRLKFGQLVDLEVLDRACDASSVDELQTRVKLREVEG